MKRILASVGVCVALFCLAGSALPKEKNSKPGPLTGTWECVSHGGPQGDTPFTLNLEQSNESVSGSVSSPMGGTQITSGTFKKKMLEIHIDTSQGNYVLTGKLKRKQMTGEWSTQDNQMKGTWEGKKKTEETR